MKQIFICDLDGCLWQQLFPSLQGELMLADEREQLVNDLNQRLKLVDIYPNFIEYYETCSPEKIIFVTGRKKADFGDVTEHQLKQLKGDKAYTAPIFYPPDAEHTKEIYRNFKIYAISDLIQELTKKYSPCVIKIFDDNKEYFEVLHLYFEHGYDGPLNPYFKTYWVQNNEDWDNPQKRIYNITRRGYY
jgi:hypothetical protein